MKRRQFIQETSLTAFAVLAFGKVSWNENKYTGNTITTTDVLGPFYRPGAPVRTDINPKGYSGKLFHLSGTVFKADGKTPLRNCRIEIWQCDQHKVYDNTSDDYHYRGTQLTDKNGKYHFITTHPVPYPATEDPSKWRPAHIHLLISAEGQQDLVTQIYFENDPHLEKDGAGSSSEAKLRTLSIKKNEQGDESVEFNVVMAKEFKPDDSVFNRLTGLYKMSDKSIIEFYRREDLLFFKWNGQIREGLAYTGNNEFSGGVKRRSSARFEIQENGSIKVYLVYFRPTYNDEVKIEGLKFFRYPQ